MSREPPGRHIAILISHLSDGGAERVATLLAARWIADGHAVTLVTLSRPDAESFGDRYALPAGIRRIALGLLRPSRNRVEGLARALGRVRALRRTLRDLAPDVAVSFGDRMSVLALLATRGTGVPTLAYEQTDPRCAPSALPWQLLRRVMYRYASGVVVQTESVAAWARRLWPRVHVIPNFVNVPTAIASPGAETGPRTLIAMGRLDPVKGFEMLIEAFASLAKRHVDWTLTILGEGPERAALEREVQRLGLEGRVRLPGRVSDPTPHLARAHVFVLSSRREGFPNALIEAMACGLPVVSFDCASGPAEIVSHEHDGLLVPPGDVRKLAAALDRLMSSGEERARMGRNARGVTTRFAPERILGLWSRLLGGGASSAA